MSVSMGLFANKNPQYEKELLNRGYRYAFSLCHHKEDAEDLVHQSWIKFSRSGKGRSEVGYFFAIIRNLYFDHWRRKQIIRFEAMESGTKEPAHGVSHQKDHARLDMETLMSQLSDEYREVLYLNAVEGFSAEEISKMIGLSRGGVLSQLSRAKQKLQTLANKDQQKERR